MKELAGCNVEDLRYVGVPYPEREIPPHGFAGCHALFLVDIADSVTRLGPSAFAGCSSLRSLAIPDTVTEIGQGTFDGCSSFSGPEHSKGFEKHWKEDLYWLHLFDKTCHPPLSDRNRGVRICGLQLFEEPEPPRVCDEHWA